MKIKKVTSITAFLAFIFMIFTSLILYVVPQGRVAYWSDWRFLGLTKTDWGNIHINVGFLFIVVLVFHTYLNWKSFLSYLKNNMKKLVVFTKEFNLSLLIIAMFVFGTHFEVPPFSNIIKVGDFFKAEAEKKYGAPPYGHAELSSLKDFTKKLNIDLSMSLKKLKEKNIIFKDENDIIVDIAKRNKITPNGLYLLFKPQEAGFKRSDTAEPGLFAGLGKRTLQEVCNDNNIKLDIAMKKLKIKNITASPAETLRVIAEKNNLRPSRVLEIIQE